MPYVLPRRTDLQDGAIQIKDLFFNKSQYKVTTEPYAQGPLYVRASDLNMTGHTAPIIVSNGDERSFLRATHGLLAYVLVYVDNDGVALTKAQAIEVVQAIQQEVIDGNALDDIEAIVENINGDYNFNGSVEDVLRILAGDKFEFNAGVKFQDNAGDYVVPMGVGSFSTPNDRKLINGDTTWETSLAEGELYQYSTNVKTYAGKTQLDSADNEIPLIIVYQNNGTLA
jgi:hypothetical protein